MEEEEETAIEFKENISEITKEAEGTILLMNTLFRGGGGGGLIIL